jgi:hypothetical protein
MNTAVRIQEVRIKDISISEDTITAHLVDGRTISVPLAWSWRLSEATPKQRANWRIIGEGHGVHWPDIDEDISAEGMLYGIPAPRPRLFSKLTLKSGKKKPTVSKGIQRIANKAGSR